MYTHNTYMYIKFSLSEFTLELLLLGERKLESCLCVESTAATK